KCREDLRDYLFLPDDYAPKLALQAPGQRRRLGERQRLEPRLWRVNEFLHPEVIVLKAHSPAGSQVRVASPRCRFAASPLQGARRAARGARFHSPARPK